MQFLGEITYIYIYISGYLKSQQHLLEELVHVALLCHKDGTLAVGHGLEELHGQA